MYKIEKIITFIFIKFILFYKFFIKKIFFIKLNCKFIPSCSTYFLEAFKKYGLLRGSYLSIKRILKCNPFNYGGYDPV